MLHKGKEVFLPTPVTKRPKKQAPTISSHYNLYLQPKICVETKTNTTEYTPSFYYQALSMSTSINNPKICSKKVVRSTTRTQPDLGTKANSQQSNSQFKTTTTSPQYYCKDTSTADKANKVNHTYVGTKVNSHSPKSLTNQNNSGMANQISKHYTVTTQPTTTNID